MDDRNAAIRYVRDGYDPNMNGAQSLNGRRVAGASFLKGYFRHAQVNEFVSVTRGDEERKDFLSEKNKYNEKIPHRAVYDNNLTRLGAVGTLYFPAPNYAEHLWKRQAFGVTNHSICGITHTTATQAVMRSMFDLRAGPQMEWDGLICTSRAVHAAIIRNMEIAEDLLRTRFGRVPPRPQMPVIPLGINCDDHAHDPQAAAALRKRMNWGEKDVAVVTISRLAPYGKFDPGPLFIALQQAQETVEKEFCLHFVACGLFADPHSEAVFKDCAKALMPDVAFHHLPGDDPVARKETLSGGDIFTFPIDNVQETFGLAPIEAMAAGLPVVVSDWDGMRDTVTNDAGFLIPTLMAGPAATAPEAEGYLSGSLSYAQYGNRLAMMTRVHIQEMANAFVTLARNPDLRKTMGEAGRSRALTRFDWQSVVPRMQDFWAELAMIRKTARKNSENHSQSNPVAPLPGDLFSSFSAAHFNHDTTRFIFTGTLERLELIYRTRRYAMMGNPAETFRILQIVAQKLCEQEPDGITCEALSRELRWNIHTIERCLLFFLKYDLATEV